MRIFVSLLIITWWSFLLIKSPIYKNLIELDFENLPILFLLLSIFATSMALYFNLFVCDVKSDRKYFYVENTFRKDKIPIEKIDKYYIDFKGFNIVFKGNTKFGNKIFFQPQYFKKKETKKYLNKIITGANSK